VPRPRQPRLGARPTPQGPGIFACALRPQARVEAHAISRTLAPASCLRSLEENLASPSWLREVFYAARSAWASPLAVQRWSGTETDQPGVGGGSRRSLEISPPGRRYHHPHRGEISQRRRLSPPATHAARAWNSSAACRPQARGLAWSPGFSAGKVALSQRPVAAIIPAASGSKGGHGRPPGGFPRPTGPRSVSKESIP